MNDIQRCPRCGKQMKLSRVHAVGSTLISKRRDCCACGHADTVLLRMEVAAIIEVVKRKRKKTLPDSAGGIPFNRKARSTTIISSVRKETC